MENMIKKEVKRTYACGCKTKTTVYFEKTDAGIDAYLEQENYTTLDHVCDDCKEKGLLSVKITGEYDSMEVYRLFHASIGIKNIIKYCHEKKIPLHNEYYPSNSQYDCTGKLIAVYASVKKGRKYITVSTQYSYDL